MLPLSSAVAWVPRGAGVVRTEDWNRDGRPDVWRFYTPDARLTRVVVDSNFDGRSDEDEQYVNGARVRRTVDRNFDDRVDLSEDFDSATHDASRQVIDVDFDGTADVLILRQSDQPVFEKWADRSGAAETAHPSSPTASDPERGATAALVTFADPFRADEAVRALIPTADESSTARVSPAVLILGGPDTRALAPAQSGPWALYDAHLSSDPISARDTRGPPSISLPRS